MITLRQIFLLIFFSFSWFCSCKKKQETTSPSVENISESVYASGVVKSRNQYQVFSTVNGLLQTKYVSEGDSIKKGDVLFSIKNETSLLNKENAQLASDFADANIKSDRLAELKINTNLAKAKMDNDLLQLQRQKNLWAQDIGTRNDLDQRELAYKNAITNYEAANLRYNDLQKQLNFNARQSKNGLAISNSVVNDYLIKSNTDGRVYSILKEAGEMVNTQSPIAIIGAANDFYLELQVDEYDIATIKLGQKALLNLDSYKGQVFEAVITKINPLMNERTRSFTVEANFISKPVALFPNLTTEANIIIRVKQQVITIPRNYLVDENYVLDENNKKVKVTTGLKDYLKVEIVNGLSATSIILKPGK
jgi:multidrug efflux pump subunit AcrA (membrane-fusion protein)